MSDDITFAWFSEAVGKVQKQKEDPERGEKWARSVMCGNRAGCDTTVVSLAVMAAAFPHLSPALLKQVPRGKHLIGVVEYGGVEQRVFVKRIHLRELMILDRVATTTAVVKPLCVVHKAGVEFTAMYPFTVMGTLEDYYCRGNLQKSQAVVKIFTQIAQSVQSLHSCSVVHCDIKPSNILMFPEADNPNDVVAMLCDFGMAKELAIDDGGGVVPSGLTLAYAPVEQRDSNEQQRRVTYASDVFALALTFIDVLTGWGPAVCTEEILGVGETFLSVLDRCLDDDHRNRPTIGYVISAIATIPRDMVFTSHSIVEKKKFVDAYANRDFLLFHCVRISNHSHVPPAMLTRTLKEVCVAPLRLGALIRGVEHILNFDRAREAPPKPTADHLVLFTQGLYLMTKELRIGVTNGSHLRVRRRILSNQYSLTSEVAQRFCLEREVRVEQMLLYSTATFPYQQAADTCMIISFAQVLVRELRRAGAKDVHLDDVIHELGKSVYGSENLSDIPSNVGRLRSVVDITGCGYCKTLGVRFNVLETVDAVADHLRSGRLALLAYRPDGKNYHSVTIYYVAADMILVKDGALPYHFDLVPMQRITTQGVFNSVHAASGAKSYRLDIRSPSKMKTGVPVTTAVVSQATATVAPTVDVTPNVAVSTSGMQLSTTAEAGNTIAERRRYNQTPLVHVLDVDIDLFRPRDDIDHAERVVAFYRRRAQGMVFGALAVEANNDLARVAKTCAELLASTGDFVRASEYYCEARTAYVRAYGVDCLDEGYVVHGLAVCLLYMDKVTESITEFDKSLAIIEGRAATDRLIPMLLYYRGCARFKLSDFERCEVDLNRAITLFKKHFGEAHVNVAKAEVALGIAVSEKRCDVTGSNSSTAPYALPILARALHSLETHCGKEHVLAAAAHCALGNLMRTLGKHQDAVKHHEQCLRSVQAHYGPSHFLVGTAEACLGLSLIDADRSREAVATLQRSLSIVEETKNPRAICRALRFMAKALTRTNSFDGAVALLKRALELESDAPLMVETRCALAYVHLLTGAIDLALSVIRPAMDVLTGISRGGEFVNTRTICHSIYASCVARNSSGGNDPPEDFVRMIFDRSCALPVLVRRTAAMQFDTLWKDRNEVILCCAEGRDAPLFARAQEGTDQSDSHILDDIVERCEYLEYPLHVICKSKGRRGSGVAASSFVNVYEKRLCTLQERVNEACDKRLSEHEGREIMHEVLRGMHFLHSKNIAHLHISAALINLYRQEANTIRARISGMGRARKLTAISLPGPSAASRSDTTSDVWMWAKTFFSTVCGKGSYASCDGLSTQLLTMLSKCLDEDATKRPQAHELLCDEYFDGLWAPRSTSTAIMGRAELRKLYNTKQFVSFWCQRVVAGEFPNIIYYHDDNGAARLTSYPSFAETVSADWIAEATGPSVRLGLLMRKIETELRGTTASTSAETVLHLYSALHATTVRMRTLLQRGEPQCYGDCYVLPVAIKRVLFSNEYWADDDEEHSAASDLMRMEREMRISTLRDCSSALAVTAVDISMVICCCSVLLRELQLRNVAKTLTFDDMVTNVLASLADAAVLPVVEPPRPYAPQQRSLPFSPLTLKTVVGSRFIGELLGDRHMRIDFRQVVDAEDMQEVLEERRLVLLLYQKQQTDGCDITIPMTVHARYSPYCIAKEVTRCAFTVIDDKQVGNRNNAFVVFHLSYASSSSTVN